MTAFSLYFCRSNVNCLCVRNIYCSFIFFLIQQVYTPQDEEDGPVESPHTLVKRQLRTRQIKIKR